MEFDLAVELFFPQNFLFEGGDVALQLPTPQVDAYGIVELLRRVEPPARDLPTEALIEGVEVQRVKFESDMRGLLPIYVIKCAGYVHPEL